MLQPFNEYLHASPVQYTQINSIGVVCQSCVHAIISIRTRYCTQLAFFFFLRDFIFKKTLFEKLAYWFIIFNGED